MIEILLLTFSPLLRVHFSQDTRHLSYATGYPAPSSCVTLIPLTPSSYQLHTPPRALKQLKTAFLKSPFRTRTFGVNNELTCPTGNFETTQPIQQRSNISVCINYMQEPPNTTFQSSPTPLSCWLFRFKYKIHAIAILSLQRLIFILPLGVRNWTASDMGPIPLELRAWILK